MKIFFPVIGCHFRLNEDAHIRLLTDKNNAKFLNYLNLLPGCLPVAAWERNGNIQTIDVTLEKDSLMTIDKIHGKGLEAEVHFSIHVEGIVAGKKSRFAVHKFAMLLKDINNKFDVSY
jgi:hypothetical protein